ncbi:MAG: NAD(P)-dependent oxidoreductase [Xanthomonadales bacterium]|nr:dTDP-glucose 4,6-dehydratase [Xanthomonadales bacterium]MCC6593175.1 NAD(P)-dependent oxidoreductase [Xanthomonadales bacterium]MCE7930725.1 NAD(P)-dependent oxidoreductase [Xanthomonadales bacterium PRO6]
MSKKVLVTGGLGTIGRGLIQELRGRGFEVFSCDLRHSEDEVGFSLRTDVRDPAYARCDIGEFRQIERVFRQWGPFDYVYNCAAEFGRWNGEDFYEQLWRSNAVGTKNLIRLQEQQGFRLIHFSSSEVYGDWPNIMAEQVMDQYEIRQMNDYAMTKWVNEMQIHNSRQQYGTESVIVRIFNTYGPGEYYSPYRSVNARFVYCALRGLPWVVFRGYSRTSTYLSDSVRTLANIAERFVPGETYNIGGQHLHSIEELSDIVLAATGASPSLVEYKDAEVLTTRDKRVDTSKARDHLGHKDSVSLAEGVALTVAWMKDAYRI